MGRKQEYTLKTHGKQFANAEIVQQLRQKVGRIKLLPRFFIKVQEYLVQADAMDDVEQDTLDLQWVKRLVKDKTDDVAGQNSE